MDMCRSHTRSMLVLQTRWLSIVANFVYVDWLGEKSRERNSISEDLAAPFKHASVNE